jgi:hypothetical protein
MFVYNILMPKKLTLTLIAVVLLTPLFFQLSAYSAGAADVNPPSSFANLIGKVTYKQLGRFMGNAQRVTPAPNVDIEVVGFFDKSKKFETTTDANGNYSVQVPAGMYKVEVDDDSSSKTDFFTPPFRFERVREDRAQTANFKGLVF